MTRKHIEEENHTLETTISISLEDAQKLGQEYGELMIKESLSDEEDARIDHILHLATLSDSVEFWVSHAACEYGAKIGLLSPDALKSYEDQRAILRERIDTYQFSDPNDEAILYKLIRQSQTSTDAKHQEAHNQNNQNQNATPVSPSEKQHSKQVKAVKSNKKGSVKKVNRRKTNKKTVRNQ